MNADKFRETYKEEALEYLEQIEQGLLVLEKNAHDSNAIDAVFRAMHSLKGGASMFGFSEINDLSHQLETAYENIRSGTASFDSELASLTFKAVDVIRNLLDDKEEQENVEEINNAVKEFLFEESHSGKKEYDYFEENIQRNASSQKTYHITFVPGANILGEGSNPVYLLDELTGLGKSQVFLRTDKLPPLHEMNTEKCYLWWEIILQTSESEEEIREVFMFVEDESTIEVSLLSEVGLLDIPELQNELKELSSDVPIPIEKLKNYQQSKGIQPQNQKHKSDTGTIRVSSDKIDKLIKIVGEMVTFDSRLAMYATKTQNTELMEMGESLRKLTERLREVTFDISLVPLSVMMLRFKRLVRDLSLSQGKQTVFLTAGEETQLDKTVVEHLYDPVMHILRNSISHGIESAEERKNAGKVPEGTIKLVAYYSGPEVHIDISDDGSGFNIERIRKTAIKKGFISGKESKSDDELLNLTFLPGFSTVTEADDLSGRGVGMDVIRKKLQEINGEVSISSTPGKGTTLKLVIPLTLSIVDGLSVRVDDLHLVLPVSVVDRIESVETTAFKGNKQVLSLNGESVPVIPLFFDMEDKTDEPYFPVIVIRFQEKKYGLIVHEVTGTSQVVLKSLGKFLKRMDVFSGGCVLGDGTIGYVLDIRKFIGRMQQPGKHLANEK